MSVVERVFVFLGPSLSRDMAKTILPQAYYLPPVRCGDVVRALRLKPDVMVIIDGFFERTAAVWHKEILLTLSKGVAVYGAGSMGALRAAELCDLGMCGVGKIFEAYRGGVIQDDDEVAVLHQDAEHQYKAITDAMVNIRATVERALCERVIDDAMASHIINAAKALYYQRRTLEKACDGEQFEHFLSWCADGGYVDQKAEDAMDVLRVIRDSERKCVFLHPLSHTACLHTLRRMVCAEPFMVNADWLPIQERVALAALSLDKYYTLAKRLARMMAIVYALALKRCRTDEDDTCFGYTWYDEAWCQANDCDDFTGFLARMQYLAKISGFDPSGILPEDVRYYMLSFMRLSGDYTYYKENDEDILHALRYDDIGKYNALVYTAYLWRVIEGAILHAGLIMQDVTQETYIHRFCRLHGLHHPSELETWLQAQDLEEEALKQLVTMAVHFDYIVKSNNLDVIGAFEREDETWWFLDALYVMDIYGWAKQYIP